MAFSLVIIEGNSFKLFSCASEDTRVILDRLLVNQAVFVASLVTNTDVQVSVSGNNNQVNGNRLGNKTQNVQLVVFKVSLLDIPCFSTFKRQHPHSIVRVIGQKSERSVTFAPNRNKQFRRVKTFRIFSEFEQLMQRRPTDT